MACLPCGRNFHSECENDNGCENCHTDEVQLLRAFKRNVGQPLKNPEDIKDPYSTGRKRAAIAFPIHKTNPCEWRGLKNCGGGLKPIVGCMQGLQVDAHHGPNKDPLENTPGNVHRICKSCHNRWHTANDSIYNQLVYKKTVHDPEIATELELMASEAEWRIKT